MSQCTKCHTLLGRWQPVIRSDCNCNKVCLCLNCYNKQPRSQRRCECGYWYYDVRGSCQRELFEHRAVLAVFCGLMTQSWFHTVLWECGHLFYLFLLAVFALVVGLVGFTIQILPAVILMTCVGGVAHLLIDELFKV